MKYLAPILTSATFVTLFLATPGVSTVAGLLFYLAIGGGGSTAASLRLSRAFSNAKALRTGAADQKTLDIMDERRAALDRVTELEQANQALRDEKIGLEREVEKARASAEKDKSISFDGRHILMKELGRGGMAIALKIVDAQLQLEKVWKVPLPEILADADNLERFVKGEAKSMVTINHKNIVRFYNLGFVDHATYEVLTGISLRGMENVPNKIPYIEMEFIPHPTLFQKHQVERAKGYFGFPLEYALNIGIAIAKGLQAAYAKGIIHRDLKPENIFVVPHEREPGKETAKIGDFGLAKIVTAKSRYTQAGSIKGTPEYMSPEQAWPVDKEGKVIELDWRTDQYALGVILYEMLAGDPPLGYSAHCETFEAYQYKILHAEVPDIRNKVQVPDEVWAVIKRMLAKDRKQRFSSWEECIHALQNALQKLNPDYATATDATAVAAIELDGAPKRKN
jgi:serine/threonine-protein kinase